MYQIMYSSVAVRSYSQADLADMLDAFRAFNSSENISGLLIYHNGVFVQVIEGEKAVLQALYERIKQDKRHEAVITLLEKEIARQEFPDWSMGFAAEVEAQMQQMEGYQSIFFIESAPRLALVEDEKTLRTMRGHAHEILIAMRDELLAEDLQRKMH